LEDLAVGDGVVVIWVVIFGCLFKDVESFNGIEVGAFSLGV
jgi:hypothetical protein